MCSSLGANVLYLHCSTRTCSNARFAMTFAADPTGTRGPIQGFYGLMFADEGALVSVSDEPAVVATELGTIRCDGADDFKDAQFIMVHCGACACACSNCVVCTRAESTPWHCDTAQPITDNANPPGNPRPATPGAGGSSFGPAAPATELVVEVQELKCEKVECQGGWYRLYDSLNGLTVFCGDFEAHLGASLEVNFGAGDWDQHVCFQQLFCVDAVERLWVGQGGGHSHSFVHEAEPTKSRDDSDTATANISLDPLCGVQMSEQDVFADEKLNQAEMNALVQEYKQELDLPCEAMVKWKDDCKKEEKTVESVMMICVACIYLYPHRGHCPEIFPEISYAALHGHLPAFL